MLYLRLFFEFFKTGLFAVGGGLATLPFLSAMGEKTGWFTQAQLANMIAISESTPGPIGVNMATYVGFETGGALGSVVATIGLITPSVMVIMVVSSFLKKYKDNKYVQAVFYGLRAASVALIASSLLSVVEMSLLSVDVYNTTGNILDIFNFLNIMIAIALYAAIKKYNAHPAVFLLVSAILGIVLGL
ncbi:MAG: chromate transporter [Erysipelotrichales bacterium]|nr:chromate transporter [Erysipelotrichales bacterium]